MNPEHQQSDPLSPKDNHENEFEEDIDESTNESDVDNALDENTSTNTSSKHLPLWGIIAIWVAVWSCLYVYYNC